MAAGSLSPETFTMPVICHRWVMIPVNCYWLGVCKECYGSHLVGTEYSYLQGVHYLPHQKAVGLDPAYSHLSLLAIRYHELTKLYVCFQVV